MTCKPAPPAIAKVICSGNLVLDILVRPIDSFPWGTTTRVESIEQHLGGNGANTSYALAKLGVPVRTLGMVGLDAFGETVLAGLASAGVDLSGIARSPAGTATSIGLVNSRGERQFLHRLGASVDVFPNPLRFDGRLAEGFSHYHLASPFALPRLRPHLVETLRNAKEAGLTTSLDTQWDAEGRWLKDLGPCLPYVDLLFMNEDEARMVTGTGQPAAAARMLRSHGACSVIVKLGEKGCSVFAEDEPIHAPAIRVPAVDTTGAGDCFAGGFLAALHRGASWSAAARFANAVAALSIQKLGAITGLLSFEETERWLKS